jgi:hypothetical protein
MRKKLPLCQYRFEQKKFLAIPADFGAIALGLELSGRGSMKARWIPYLPPCVFIAPSS